VLVHTKHNRKGKQVVLAPLSSNPNLIHPPWRYIEHPTNTGHLSYVDTMPHTLPCTLQMQLQNTSVILQKYRGQMKYPHINYCINTHYTLGINSMFRSRRSDVMSSDEYVCCRPKNVRHSTGFTNCQLFMKMRRHVNTPVFCIHTTNSKWR
jgi:hypothetical protein